MSPNERRDHLLEVGLELFGESSYDALSTDEIAERGGISRGLLFHYFGNKRGYYVAVIREAADRLLERSRAVGDEFVLAAGGSPRAQLDIFLSFVEENAGLFTLLMQSGVGVDGQVKEIVDGARHVLASRVAPELGAASAGEPTTEADGAGARLERLALTAWIGAVEALAIEWADLRRRGDITTERQDLVELLIQMLPPALRRQRPQR